LRIDISPSFLIFWVIIGSALYVFGIQPRGVANDGAPTNMNLSFTLDNQPSGGFHSAGNLGATGFNPGVPVFIKMDLEESSHHFIAHVGRNSTFLLDYIIYTSVANTTVDSTTTPQVSPTGLPQSAPSPDIDPLVSNFCYFHFDRWSKLIANQPTCFSGKRKNITSPPSLQLLAVALVS